MVPRQSQADRDLGIQPRRIRPPATDLALDLGEMPPIRFRQRACDPGLVALLNGGGVLPLSVRGDRLL